LDSTALAATMECAANAALLAAILTML